MLRYLRMALRRRRIEVQLHSFILQHHTRLGISFTTWTVYFRGKSPIVFTEYEGLWSGRRGGVEISSVPE
jgi:hypothetical protein